MHGPINTKERKKENFYFTHSHGYVTETLVFQYCATNRSQTITRFREQKILYSDTSANE